MTLLTLPGLIDPHVHLRDPGQTEKEDFYTGTSAALAGGFTTILDMPNNKIPIFSKKELEKKMNIARKKIVCDVGFYFGSVGDNVPEFQRIVNKVHGLKLYLNNTTGGFLIGKNDLNRIFKKWSKHKPILVHAEEKMVDAVMKLVAKYGNKVHFCHIALRYELERIIKAKYGGLPVTCGVTPHHLFLTEKNSKKLGPFGKMRPPLPTKKDQNFLWKNLSYIDVLESDHAPHTIQEKRSGNPPNGVPGLETTLPLLLTAVSGGKLTLNEIVRLCFTSPAKIFGIQTNQKTTVDIDPNIRYTIERKNLKTKCGWFPFEGYRIRGKVIRVLIRGKKVFEDGKIFARPGFGKIV